MVRVTRSGRGSALFHQDTVGAHVPGAAVPGGTGSRCPMKSPMKPRGEDRSPRSSRSVPAAALAAAFGWLVPGGGYLLMGRRRQFALFLLLISTAFGAGMVLHGGNLWPEPAQLQGLDGFYTLDRKSV